MQDKLLCCPGKSNFSEGENAFQRQVELLRDGIERGSLQRLNEMRSDVPGTIATVGLSAAFCGGLALARRSGGRWSVAADSAAYILGGFLGVDVLRRAVPTFGAMADTFSSPENLEINKQLVAANLGTALIDYPMMMVCGYGGLRIGAIRSTGSLMSGLSFFCYVAGTTSTISLACEKTPRTALRYPRGITRFTEPMVDLGGFPDGVQYFGQKRVTLLPGGKTRYNTEDGTIVVGDRFELKVTNQKDGKSTTRYYDGYSHIAPSSVVSGPDGMIVVRFPVRQNSSGGAKYASSLQIEPREARAVHGFPDGTKEESHWDGVGYYGAKVEHHVDGTTTMKYNHVSHQVIGVLNRDRTLLTVEDDAGKQQAFRWNTLYKRYLR